MQPSIHQTKVTDWLQNDADCSDAVVNSVAGSGKSTLLKLAAQTISSTNISIQDCLVLVFNRKNKDALVKKLDYKWRGSISTVHSAGYKTLKSYLSARKFTVDGFKYRNLAKLASSEELEQYVKIIRSEQGKRISQRFQRLV